MELLLLSNSTLPGKGWMEHALPLIAEQLNGRRSAVFIPFAGVTQTWDEYTEKTAVDSIGQRNSYVKTWGCGGFLNETNIYSRGKSLCF